MENCLVKEEQSSNEIHVNKMHFRVVSKHPQYSNEEAEKKKKDMRSSLYHIFKNYR